MIDFSKFEDNLAQKTQVKSDSTPTEALAFEEVIVSSDGTASNARSMGRVNDMMAVLLTAIVLLAPLPLGSSRPVPWLILTAVMAILTIAHGLLSRRNAPGRSDPARQHLWLIIPGAVTLLAIVAQLLPIGYGAINGVAADLAPDRLTLDAGATMIGALRFAGYGLFMILMIQVSENIIRVQRMMRWIYFGILVHAIVGLISFSFLGDRFLWGDKEYYLGYATGTFVNRNSFATFLGFGVVLGFALLGEKLHAPRIRMPGGRKQWSATTLDIALLICTIMLLVATLVATQSRMGLFATTVAAMFTLIAMDLKGGSHLLSTLAKASLLAVVCLIFLVLSGEGVIERALLSERDLSNRFDIYTATWGMIKERPFFGWGFDSFPIAFELRHPEGLSASLVYDRAHSTYLAHWVELGLIVGSLPIIVVAAAFAKSFQHLWRRKAGYTQAAAACGVILLGAIHSTVDFSLEIAANVYLFIAIMALGVSHLRRRQSAGGKRP